MEYVLVKASDKILSADAIGKVTCKFFLTEHKLYDLVAIDEKFFTLKDKRTGEQTKANQIYVRV